jgi:hypothetical protein
MAILHYQFKAQPEVTAILFLSLLLWVVVALVAGQLEHLVLLVAVEDLDVAALALVKTHPLISVVVAVMAQYLSGLGDLYKLIESKL